ncbi:unnamed protein product, partial [Dicrocoelium dendriticum]
MQVLHYVITLLTIGNIYIPASATRNVYSPSSSFNYPSADAIIQLHPESQSVTLNSTVRLQCRVRVLTDLNTGTGAQVYWSKNDFGIGGSREDIQEYGRSARYPYSRYDLPYNLKEGQYDLQITNVELSDEGSYVCQVNFMKKQYLSQTAVLSVQVPSEAPRFLQVTKEGKGAEVEVGSSTPVIVEDGSLLVLKCVARHGKPGARLSWSIDGVPVQPDPDQSGKLSTFRAGFRGNLTFDVVPSANFPRLKDAVSQMSARLSKLHHGKLIECRAANSGYGEHALRPALTRLEVQYAPVVSIQIRPQRHENEYMEHDIITAECTAHGRPDSFTWEWFVNGRQIESITDPWYRLRLTRNLHNAVFRCVAISNKKGNAETTVRVKFGPQFVEPSTLLYTASPGEDVAMDCPARGNPTPRIEWLREGGHEVLHRGVTYRKDNLREEDFGTYTCTALSEDFPPVSKQMFIAKRKPPSIQPNPVVHARLGRPARLRCTVNSVPLPPAGQTHWYFNGRALRSDTQHIFEREEFLGGVVLILHIMYVMTTDYGKYNCSVQNGYGSDWKLIELRPQEDIPLQFIIGAAVAIGILLIAGIAILCVCRRRVCNRKYRKANSSRNQMCNSVRCTQPPPHDYGVMNSEFKAPCSNSEETCRPNFYPWFSSNSQPQASYLRCGNEMEDRRSPRSGAKTNTDNCTLEDFNVDAYNNSSLPAGLTTTYYPNISSCQMIQPLSNGGGGYLSAIDSRLLTTAHSPYFSGCPTVFTGADMVPGSLHSRPDFLPETISLQPYGKCDVISGSCLYTTDSGQLVATVPQITTLDLTNGIPARLTSHSVYSGDGGSGRSSLEHNHLSASIPSKCEVIDNTSSPKYVDLQRPVTPSEPTHLGVHGIAYVIDGHTTN